MAKQVIILERQDGSPIIYRVAFWLQVPAARQSYFANAAAVSVWKGASAAENSALAAGQIYEVVETVAMLPGDTEQAIAAALQVRWTNKQLEFNNSVLLYRYGTYWDGAGWTIVSA